MSKKRGHGEGTIYKDVKGLWHGQASLPNGKRKSFYGRTRREVQEKMAQIRREIDAGMHGSIDGEKSLREFAAGWLDHHRYRLRGKTYRGYESIARLHLDVIGDIALTKLRPLDLQEHYTRKLHQYSQTTVHHMHAFLHVVLDNAVRLGLIPRNCADYVDAPGIRTREIQPLSQNDVQTMLSAMRYNRIGALFVLALATGMREAELLGLRWEDVDFEHARIRVSMTLHLVKGVFTLEPPKSRYSLRTLPLPQAAIDALQSYRVRQLQEQDMIGAAWADRWGLIFTTDAGLPIRYDWLIREFRRVIGPVGLPETTTIHDLRHTFATLLIEKGVPIKVVSELLGHSSIGITLAIYGHVTPRMRDSALEHLGDILQLPDRQ